MTGRTGIVLVGIGGYGSLYVDGLLRKYDSRDWEIKGVVDPYPEGCDKYRDLINLGIPVFSSLDDFYRESYADLAVISSPIHYHKEHACKALFHGSHILCEKPVAAAIQDVIDIQKARDESGRIAAIGYQWSYSDAILRLKNDIMNGRFGRPVSMKTIVLWPRSRSYYARPWAGKIKHESGRWILDSVAANATAHYLHNMFFLLGKAEDRSADLSFVAAETYKANPIENYDTAIFRAITSNGVVLLFIASHAVESCRGPEFEFVFEKAVAKYKADINGGKACITAALDDGTTIDYGSPNGDDLTKLWKTLEAIRNNGTVTCGLEAAATHTVCINCVQEIIPNPPYFPEELICCDEASQVTWVKGLAEDLNRCYAEWKLPSEAAMAWAHPAASTAADGYRFFRG